MFHSFLDKKGYSWKRLRGSKGYTPESDLEACRDEIRLQTKKYMWLKKPNGQDMTHGEMIKKFVFFQLELEASIGCKAWKNRN